MTPMSEKKTANSSSGGSLEKFVPVLLIVSIALAFAVGVLWQKVSSIEKGKPGATPDTVAGTQAQKPQVALETIKSLFDQDVIKFGKADKKLLIVEVSDPSCPYCAIASGKNPEINKQAGQQFLTADSGGKYVPPVPEFRKLVESGQASMIYLYTPGHGNGEMGTKALYCANEKDKFWPVHDLLMTNAGYNLLNEEVKNDKSKSQQLADFLKSAIDPAFLKECLDSGKYDGRLSNDIALANSLGITGTPGFYLNTTPFFGAYSYSDMEPAVKEALK